MVRSRAVVVVTVLAATSVLGWWFGEQRRAADRRTASCRCSTATPSSCAAPVCPTRRSGCWVSTRRRRTIPRSRCSATGPEAAAYTASRLFGQVVRLEDDVERHDIYGRRLAYVYLDGAQLRARAAAQGLRAPARHRAQPRARARDARRRAERACAWRRPVGCVRAELNARPLLAPAASTTAPASDPLG